MPRERYQQYLTKQDLNQFIEPLLHHYFQQPIDLKHSSFINENGINRGWNATILLPNQITDHYTTLSFFKQGDLWEQRLAPQGKRQKDIQYHYRVSEERTITLKNSVEIEGFSDKRIDNQYFSFSLTREEHLIKSCFKLKVRNIPIEGYGYFKAELRKMDQILKQRYRIKWGSYF